MKCELVPVLIICPHRADAEQMTIEIAAALHAKTRRKKYAKLLGTETERKAASFVQQFAEYDNDNNEMNWNALVAAATELFPDTAMRRITVTDPYGGRGFDFDVRDKAANNRGGMLVIATTIPPGRDWVQWKGRTARGGRLMLLPQ